MAARMKIAGIDDFVVLEKRPDLGGVWLDNSYPGAACDTESHLYCYSFHPHLRVSAMYAGRNELLHYLKSLATRFDRGTPAIQPRDSQRRMGRRRQPLAVRTE